MCVFSNLKWNTSGLWLHSLKIKLLRDRKGSVYLPILVPPDTGIDEICLDMVIPAFEFFFKEFSVEEIQESQFCSHTVNFWQGGQFGTVAGWTE